jgi:glycosyltransferase involved in cell wall biosynthesis
MSKQNGIIWPLSKEEGELNITISNPEDSGAFNSDPDGIVIMTDGWTDGPVAAALRGGNNALAVLEVIARLGIREIIIYHNEERISQLEEIFLSTVVPAAHELFEKARILWRSDPSFTDMVQSVGGEYKMLFVGAPLTASEANPLFHKIKNVYKGKIAIVRGPVREIEFTKSDEIFKWVRERTYDATDFALAMVLLNYKKKLNVKVDVILPALNEEKTIGKVIETALEVKNSGIIDNVIIIDSGSGDDTVQIAKSYNLPVYLHKKIKPELGSYSGKGEALFKSYFVSDADILAWVDTDIENIGPTFFYGLIGPILFNSDIKFVKGYYARPIRIESYGIELGGGRVTEIMARPWINLYYPHLAGYIQPLAGTVAIYRSLFERLKIPTNYGVEIAMLVQAVEQCGLWSTCQVNLGEVIHKSKDIAGLSEMSFQIMQVLDNLLNNLEVTEAKNNALRQIFSSRGHFEVSIKKFNNYWREFKAAEG